MSDDCPYCAGRTLILTPEARSLFRDLRRQADIEAAKPVVPMTDDEFMAFLNHPDRTAHLTGDDDD